MSGDADSLEDILLFRRALECVTAKDAALLEDGLRHQLDVSSPAVAELDPESLVWMLHFGLLESMVDPRDRLFVKTTKRGRRVLEEHRRRVGGPMPKKRYYRKPELVS